MRIYEWPFDPWWHFRSNLVPKNLSRLKFPRIRWFLWNLGLTLLTIPNDAVLVFSNMLSFPAVNGPKLDRNGPKLWTLAAFHLRQNSKFWRIFQTLRFSYWRLPMVKDSARSNNIWASKGPENPKKSPFHGHWTGAKKFATTYALLMKLTTDIYLNKIFHMAKSCSVSHKVYKGADKKALKISQKKFFLDQFRPFLNASKNCSISDASSCLLSLVKNLGCFCGALVKNPP